MFSCQVYDEKRNRGEKSTELCASCFQNIRPWRSTVIGYYLTIINSRNPHILLLALNRLRNWLCETSNILDIFWFEGFLSFPQLFTFGGNRKHTLLVWLNIYIIYHDVLHQKLPDVKAIFNSFEWIHGYILWRIFKTQRIKFVQIFDKLSLIYITLISFYNLFLFFERNFDSDGCRNGNHLRKRATMNF